MIVKKVIAVLMGAAFVAGVTGAALAQTPAPAPKTDKPAETTTKKPMAHSAFGTVKAAAADSIVVAGKTKGKDAEWTFAVDPKTKIRKAGKDITAADLAAGDAVSVHYHDDGGKNVADSVMVRPAKKPAAAAAAPAAPAKEDAKK
jgi:hypothetical protein